MLTDFVSYAARVRDIATSTPDRTAVVSVPAHGPDKVLTWAELLERSTRRARLLAQRGLTAGSLTVVGLPNGIEHIVTSVAAWQLGACVLPLNPRAPAPERNRHLALAAPAVVVADWPDVPNVLLPSGLVAEDGFDATVLPDLVAEPGKAIGTGGSVGSPKIIVSPGPWGYQPAALQSLVEFGWAPELVQLLPGPLYHNFGFDWCYQGLLSSHVVVLLERFDAERAVAAIERHHVQLAGLVPTMMGRIARLPDISERDLSSLQSIMHSAGPCPAWIKESWIGLIGGERVIEGYGASEGYGNTVINGVEWSAHPGSVGRPFHSELRILDDRRREVATGEVGEVFMRRTGQPVRYIGVESPSLTSDGFGTVGDLGWVDEDGYLYLADRRVDLIISGGANIYPAEVEGALSEHHAIADVAVIGLPDPEWGKRVHAILAVRPGMPQPTAEELTGHCRARLTAYKAPKSYEFVELLPRDDGGKLRRMALVADRCR